MNIEIGQQYFHKYAKLWMEVVEIIDDCTLKLEAVSEEFHKITFWYNKNNLREIIQ